MKWGLVDCLVPLPYKLRLCYSFSLPLYSLSLSHCNLYNLSLFLDRFISRLYLCILYLCILCPVHDCFTVSLYSVLCLGILFFYCLASFAAARPSLHLATSFSLSASMLSPFPSPLPSMTTFPTESHYEDINHVFLENISYPYIQFLEVLNVLHH